MLVLSLSTVLDMVIVGLYNAESHRFVVHYESTPHSSVECLLPLVQEVLQESGVTCTELSRIAVINGPGRFTDVRVAVAATKGLALVHNTPVVAVTLPQLVSWILRTKHDCKTDIYVVMPGIRNNFYTQMISGSGENISNIELLSGSGVSEKLLGISCMVVECGYERSVTAFGGFFCPILYSTLALYALEMSCISYDDVELVYGKPLILDKCKMIY